MAKPKAAPGSKSTPASPLALFASTSCHDEPSLFSRTTPLSPLTGVANKATFVEGDLFKADLSKATVITMFLLPSINMQLRPSLLNLKPGTRVVANTFTMEDWQADQTESVTDNCSSWCTALLWIVPAKVQGTWKLADGGELTLEQRYQVITGTLRQGPSTMNINVGKVIGDQITFTAGTSQYTGRVNGNAIDGISQTSTGWRAFPGRATCASSRTRSSAPWRSRVPAPRSRSIVSRRRFAPRPARRRSPRARAGR